MSAEKTPWVIVVEDMDDGKAREVGKLLGSHGVTGKFCRGTLADVLARNAREGGVPHGQGKGINR